MSKAIEVFSRGFGDIGTTALDYYSRKKQDEQDALMRQQEIQRYTSVMDERPMTEEESPIAEKQRQLEFIRRGGAIENTKALPFGAGTDYWSALQKRETQRAQMEAQAKATAERIAAQEKLQGQKLEGQKELEGLRNTNRAKSQEDRQQHDKAMIKARELSSRSLINARAAIDNEKDERKRARMQLAHENAMTRAKQAEEQYKNAQSDDERKVAYSQLQAANQLLGSIIKAGGTPPAKPNTQPQQPKTKDPYPYKAGKLAFSSEKAANVWNKADLATRQKLKAKFGSWTAVRDAIDNSAR